MNHRTSRKQAVRATEIDPSGTPQTNNPAHGLPVTSGSPLEFPLAQGGGLTGICPECKGRLLGSDVIEDNVCTECGDEFCGADCLDKHDPDQCRLEMEIGAAEFNHPEDR